jgi:hypothetical protein
MNPQTEIEEREKKKKKVKIKMTTTETARSQTPDGIPPNRRNQINLQPQTHGSVQPICVPFVL